MNPIERMKEIYANRDRIRRQREQAELGDLEADGMPKADFDEPVVLTPVGGLAEFINTNVRKPAVSEPLLFGDIDLKPGAYRAPTAYWNEDELVDPKTCDLKLGDIVRTNLTGTLFRVIELLHRGFVGQCVKDNLMWFKGDEGIFTRRAVTLIAGAMQEESGELGWDEEDEFTEERQTLPVDSEERKGIPLASGVVDYFPAALAEVAKVSKAGNDKHNPGQPLHHARGKSMDHADCLMRHFVDRGHIDPGTGVRHSAEVAWRALAMLQQELEDEGLAPLPRGAKL